MSDLATLLPELRRPFPAEVVKWKIQTNPKEGRKALCVAYMDARMVAARLNALAPDWSDEYGEGLHGSIVCRLHVCGQTREDVGWAEVFDDKGKVTDNGIKGLYSDAFKRAAVKFGIGAFLYALPKQFVGAEDLIQRGRNYYLPPKTEGQIRARYVTWLKGEGKVFGEPLDHGDHEAPDAPEEAPANGEVTTNGNVAEHLAASVAPMGEKAQASLTALHEQFVEGDGDLQRLNLKLAEIGADTFADALELDRQRGKQLADFLRAEMA